MGQRVFTILAVLVMALPGQALAESCQDNPHALGTSRVLTLDTSKGLEVGQQYGHDLPLANKEVVLTFDDGPLPLFSEKVRRTLKAECVRATFFLVGRNAASHPDFVRQLAADGHTIGSHTFSHAMNFDKKPFAFGVSQIDRGIFAVNKALKGSPDQETVAPFFRFPGLNGTHELRGRLKQRGIGVFDINIEGGDWIKGTSSDDVLRRVMRQLRRERRGIVLLHDIQQRTAEMLPRFLKLLKKQGYKVVHLVPAGNLKPEDMLIAQIGIEEIRDEIGFMKTNPVPEIKKPRHAGTKLETASIKAPVTPLLPEGLETKQNAQTADHIDKEPAHRNPERRLRLASVRYDAAQDDIEKVYRERRARYEPTRHRDVIPSQAYAPQPRSYQMEAHAAGRPSASKYLLNSLFDSLR